MVSLNLGSTHNYKYDKIGNLVADKSEEIEEISWTMQGKVKEIRRTAGSDKPNLKFAYERHGQILMLSFFLLFCQYSMAQTFSSEERRKMAENILNSVINDAIFDSVYKQKRVYFLANELLTEDSPLVLKRKKCKVLILGRDKLKKNKQYVVLGDFTLNWNNPTSVRVQIEVMPDSKLLNVLLKKEDEKWIIKNHVIFED